MTFNGTRVPKGPPPPDSMEWPDWAKPMNEVGPIVASSVPPPPLPCEMRGTEGGRNEGAARPEEPSRSVTDLPELQAFTPQEGSVLAGDWITQAIAGHRNHVRDVWSVVGGGPP